MEVSEWHKWRAGGIGASDSPVVMGVSPYSTRFQLWQEKTGEVVRDASNWATRRGNELEPKARAQYELEMNQDMPPAFLEHPVYPFIRASLDGFGNNIVLELKCPGAEDHALAVAGKVPEKYYPQLQHQLLVSSASVAHYYSFDGERGVMVQVLPDLVYCEKLLKELHSFWQLVQTKTPPELCDRDFKTIQDGGVKNLVMRWLAAKSALDSATHLEKELKEKITVQLKDHPRWRHAGVKIQNVTRQGNVDYKKIQALEGLDLNQYRGKPSNYWLLSAPKDTEVLVS